MPKPKADNGKEKYGKELKTDDLIKMVNNHHEEVKEKEEKEAREKARKRTDLGIIIGLLATFILLIAGIFIKTHYYPNDNGKGYYKYTDEVQPNGNHYIFTTGE